MKHKRCPLCENEKNTTVFEINQCAIVPYTIRKESANEDSLYEDIKIQQCEACGHQWNIKHERNDLISSYGNEVAACVPVTDNMKIRFKELSDYVQNLTGKRGKTADIGAGSCCFALNFAEHSKNIDIYEPSIQTRGITLPDNVNMINEVFKNDNREKYDLIILKQVLEHIADTKMFLELISESVSKDGFLYLEIPSGDYINKKQSCYDYHSQHIHYFKESSIEMALRGLDFNIIDKRYIMEGHDVGYMLQKTGRLVANFSNIAKKDLVKNSQTKKIAKALVDENEKVVGVYGINAYSQSFLAIHREELESKNLIYFDDNAHAQGKYPANKKNTSQIVQPTIDNVNTCDAIYIACYLHDGTIEKKLKKLGFQGRLISLRPQAD